MGWRVIGKELTDRIGNVVREFKVWFKPSEEQYYYDRIQEGTIPPDQRERFMRKAKVQYRAKDARGIWRYTTYAPQPEQVPESPGDVGVPSGRRDIRGAPEQPTGLPQEPEAVAKQPRLYRFTYGINYVLRNRRYSVTATGLSSTPEDTQLAEAVREKAVMRVREHVSDAARSQRVYSVNELPWVRFGNIEIGDVTSYDPSQVGQGEPLPEGEDIVREMYVGEGWQAIPWSMRPNDEPYGFVSDTAPDYKGVYSPRSERDVERSAPEPVESPEQMRLESFGSAIPNFDEGEVRTGGNDDLRPQDYKPPRL